MLIIINYYYYICGSLCPLVHKTSTLSVHATTFASNSRETEAKRQEQKPWLMWPRGH